MFLVISWISLSHAAAHRHHLFPIINWWSVKCFTACSLAWKIKARKEFFPRHFPFVWLFPPSPSLPSPPTHPPTIRHQVLFLPNVEKKKRVVASGQCGGGEFESTKGRRRTNIKKVWNCFSHVFRSRSSFFSSFPLRAAFVTNFSYIFTYIQCYVYIQDKLLKRKTNARNWIFLAPSSCNTPESIELMMWNEKWIRIISI